MIAPTIAATTLRRMVRDRTALFFMIVLPVLIIVLVGSSVQEEQRFAVGLLDESDDQLGAELVADLEEAPSIELRRFDDLDGLRLAIRRSELAAGVVVPPGLADDVRAGRTTAVGLLSQPASTSGLAAEQAVRGALADQSAVVTAAAFTATEVGGEPADHLAAAARASMAVEPLTVTTTVQGESRFLPLGFTYSSATMLVLFVFVNAVASGGVIIQNRQQGLYARMLAAPVSPREVIAGEATTYLLLALLQSALIVVVGGVLFEVDWGDPVAATALVAVWSAVGAAAGMLAGTVLRTAEQAAAIGPMVGIALGMLGGCMWPLEIVPPVMQTIGHLVPHGWAVDSWIDLLSRNGNLVDIAPALGILAGFALVFGALAARRLRSQLST